MIYIAKNYNSQIVGIVSCKTKDSAVAYWQGKGLYPNTIDEFDIIADRENENQGYVTPILTTKEIHTYKLSNVNKTVLIIE